MKSKWIAALCVLLFTVTSVAPGLAQETIRPLSEQVGFSDPKLDELQASGQNILGESQDFQAYGHAYRLLTVWSVLPGYPDDLASVIGGSALLYKIDGGQPLLLWSQDYLKLLGQAPYLTNQRMDFFNAPPPADWTGTGKTDFAVLGSFAGTAWFSTFYYVYQIQPDNTVVSVLKGVIPAGHIVSALEIQLDGSLLMAASDVRGEMTMGLPNCCGPQAVRYFEWRGDQIQDVSSSHPEKYLPSLGGAVYQLTTAQIADPAEYSARLLELLMIYQTLGKPDAGLTLVQLLVAQAKESGQLAEATYVDTTFLPAMLQMYQSGQSFVVPDYAGPNPPAVPDFYAEIAMNP
jgi:hypothetical protein